MRCQPKFEAPRLTETGLWFRQAAQGLLAEVARMPGEAPASTLMAIPEGTPWKNSGTLNPFVAPLPRL